MTSFSDSCEKKASDFEKMSLLTWDCILAKQQKQKGKNKRFLFSDSTYRLKSLGSLILIFLITFLASKILKMPIFI